MTPKLQQLPFDELPDSLLDMADHINKEAIMLLVVHYGGTRLHVPKKLPDNHKLTALIGQDAAKELVYIFGGSYIEIPNARHFQRAIRNREIVRRKREEGLSHRDLARAFDMTERNIRNILRRKSSHSKF
jgi:Mor family transcriptional regulator